MPIIYINYVRAYLWGSFSIIQEISRWYDTWTMKCRQTFASYSFYLKYVRWLYWTFNKGLECIWWCVIHKTSTDINRGNKFYCEIRSIIIYSLFSFISHSRLSTFFFKPMLYVAYTFSLFLDIRLELSFSVVLYLAESVKDYHPTRNKNNCFKK